MKAPGTAGEARAFRPVRPGRRGARLPGTLGALAACLFFGCAGLCFLPRIGIENDEALFGMTLFQPFAGEYTLSAGHFRIPLMIMSYLGTLKAWIYLPIFHLFGTGLFALRVPMLLAGVASVWLFFLLLRRIAGERAALIGCGLLAADSTYLLTACFDWGPVALQHLLLVGGCFLLVRFYQERGHWSLFLGFFLLGLAAWDKALAFWMLSGIGIAVLAVFPRQILAVTTKRRIAVSALGFALGAMPLLIYNAENRWVTLRGNIKRDTGDIPRKARVLMVTARGDGLFGWMFDEAADTPVPHRPSGALQTASARVSALTGHPRRHGLLYAFLLALLLAPLARGQALRTILAAVVALLVAWVQMAITVNAGGSVHHAILLWPLPHLVIAVSFASASRRLGRLGVPLFAVFSTALVMSGVLVANEYYYVAWRYGGSPAWTDGIVALSDAMKRVHARSIYCVDWGILDALRLLNHGTLPLSLAAPIPKPDLGSADDHAAIDRIIGEPGALFLGHTKDFEVFPGINGKFVELAAEAGYRREGITLVNDSFGRPAYEVYRFETAGRNLSLK